MNGANDPVHRPQMQCNSQLIQMKNDEFEHGAIYIDISELACNFWNRSNTVPS